MTRRLRHALVSSAFVALLTAGCDQAAANRSVPAAPNAVPSKSVSQWTLQLKASNPQMRLEAVLGLGASGVEAKIAVPGLIDLMKDEELRPSVVRALGSIGPEAKMAVPMLIDALREDEPEVRASAAAALARIGSDAIPELAAAVPTYASYHVPPREREPWWEELIRKKPDSVITGAVIVLLAALIAAVRITQLRIRHRERLEGIAEAAAPSRRP